MKGFFKRRTEGGDGSTGRGTRSASLRPFFRRWALGAAALAAAGLIGAADAPARNPMFKGSMAQTPVTASQDQKIEILQIGRSQTYLVARFAWEKRMVDLPVRDKEDRTLIIGYVRRDVNRVSVSVRSALRELGLRALPPDSYLEKMESGGERSWLLVMPEAPGVVRISGLEKRRGSSDLDGTWEVLPTREPVGGYTLVSDPRQGFVAFIGKEDYLLVFADGQHVSPAEADSLRGGKREVQRVSLDGADFLTIGGDDKTREWVHLSADAQNANLGRLIGRIGADSTGGAQGAEGSAPPRGSGGPVDFFMADNTLSILSKSQVKTYDIRDYKAARSAGAGAEPRVEEDSIDDEPVVRISDSRAQMIYWPRRNTLSPEVGPQVSKTQKASIHLNAETSTLYRVGPKAVEELYQAPKDARIVGAGAVETLPPERAKDSALRERKRPEFMSLELVDGRGGSQEVWVDTKRGGVLEPLGKETEVLDDGTSVFRRWDKMTLVSAEMVRGLEYNARSVDNMDIHDVTPLDLSIDGRDADMRVFEVRYTKRGVPGVDWVLPPQNDFFQAAKGDTTPRAGAIFYKPGVFGGGYISPQGVLTLGFFTPDGLTIKQIGQERGPDSANARGWKIALDSTQYGPYDSGKWSVYFGTLAAPNGEPTEERGGADRPAAREWLACKVVYEPLKRDKDGKLIYYKMFYADLNDE